MKRLYFIYVALLINSLLYAQHHDDCSSAPLMSISTTNDCGANWYDINTSGSTVSTELAPTCGNWGAGKNDVWFRVIVPPTITTMGFGIGMTSPCSPFGGSKPNLAVYRGASCASLTQLGCYETGTGVLNLGVCGFSNKNISGLIPGETLWLRVWERTNVAITCKVLIATTITAPANDACANATPLSSTACNLYANGGDIQAPETCGWNSTDNSVFYTFTVTATTPQPVTITMNNVVCAGGCNEMQLAIYKANCATIGGSPSSTPANTTTYHGCANGTGTVTITATPNPLPAGNYFLVVDGCSGGLPVQTSFCSYNFTSSVMLPIGLSVFTGEILNRKAELFWETNDLDRTTYFIVEKSDENQIFYPISTPIYTQSTQKYTYTDKSLLKNSNFYRLRLHDRDGKVTYSNLIELKNTENISTNAVLYPNPFQDNLFIQTEEPVVVRFYNSLGQMLTEQQTNNALSTEKLPKGMCFYTVTTLNGKIIRTGTAYKQ